MDGFEGWLGAKLNAFKGVSSLKRLRVFACACSYLDINYFVFLHIVSQGEEESFISAMKQSPARYPLKYYNYIWLSKPSLRIFS